MRHLIIMLICVVVNIYSYNSEIKLRYEEKTNDKIDIVTETVIKKDKGYDLIGETINSKYLLQHDINGNLLSYIHHDIKTDDTLSVRREGHMLLYNVGGKIIKKEIGNMLWAQSMTALSDFILSKENKKKFFSVSGDFDKEVSKGDGVTTIKLVAKKKKLEEININGKKIQTVKVIITFPDIRSLLWRSTYWFRISDGIMVMSKQVRGGPGTPETLMVLQ